MMKDKSVLLILLVCVSMMTCRKRDAVQDALMTPEMKTACAVEEMNIRARGTVTINYVDQFDRIGVYNATSPDENGDENRDSVASFQPDSVGRRLKKLSIEESDLTAYDKDVKKTFDKYIAEAIKLMGNDLDSRRINIFNTKKMEIPSFCQNTLSDEELVKLSQRTANMSFCWINATETTNFGQYSYLDLPYLTKEQFGNFYICATDRSSTEKKRTSNTYNDDTNKRIAKSEADAQNKYIQSEDINKFPEALYIFVLGKRPVGMPVSWLRFMIYICSAGATYPKSTYMAEEGDTDYNSELTDDYTAKMKKEIALAKKLTTKRLDDRSSSMIISRFRFSKKHKREQIITEKVFTLKSDKSQEKRLKKAGHKLDNRMKILESDFNKIVKQIAKHKKDRRLKRNSKKEERKHDSKVVQKHSSVHKK